MTVDPQELEPERSGWSGDYISGDVLHPPGWDNPEFSDAPQPLSPEVLARIADDAEIERNEAARMSESSTVQARGSAHDTRVWRGVSGMWLNTTPGCVHATPA